MSPRQIAYPVLRFHSPKFATSRMSAVLTCAAMLLLFIPAAYATAIVAARSPAFVFIGADSKAIRGGDKSDTMSVCKIAQVDTYFYAAAGLTENSIVNYELHAIIEEAFRGDDTLIEKISRFDRLVQVLLSNALEYVKQDNPSFFKHTFDRGDRVALEILFTGYVEGELFLTVRNFIIERQGPISVRVAHQRNCPGNCSTGTVSYFMGSKDAMVKYAERNPQVWDAGAAPAIKELLQIQATSTPDEVGGPIDILFISNDGTHWVQTKPECREFGRRR